MKKSQFLSSLVEIDRGLPGDLKRATIRGFAYSAVLFATAILLLIALTGL